MPSAASDSQKIIAELEQKLRVQAADITRLKKQSRSLERENESLERKAQSLEAAKRELFEQLRLLIENRFGPSTEKYNIPQEDLFFDEAEALVESEPASDSDDVPEDIADTPTKPDSAKSRTRGGRLALPPELPRVDIVHDVTDGQKHCQNDGTDLVCIGEEISEQLDIIPAKIQVIRHIRRKYACKTCEDGVVTAPMPPQPLPKSNASPNLLAYSVIAKYVDALPLYRQERAFKRLGIDLPRNTLARWMIQTSELIEPLIERCRQHLHASAVIHMDETTLQVNTEPDRKASSPSYMWVQRGGPPGQQVVLYDYDASRSGQVPTRLLENYQGILVTDGYEGYAQVVRTNRLTHMGCWAHARRKFVEAQKVQPKGKVGRADQALSLIRSLYAVEQKAKTMSAEERLALRDTQSRALIEKLEVWLTKSLNQVPPKTAIGKALIYLNRQWPKLTVFPTDGRIPLDNNPAENAIRPFVIGRKNWLFSQTPKGAHASARLYSLIETARANGIEPYSYLVEVLTKLPSSKTDDELDRLLPWNQGDTIPV
ncbi:IS66 family transposase [Marinobacter sp.]|uniref:IS66 family transposase n=1 Tax=Marinobacter sp. TaxID=50741 RepID=UPI003A92D0E7